MFIFGALLSSSYIFSAMAYDNGVGATPPMGNYFFLDCNSSSANFAI